MHDEQAIEAAPANLALTDCGRRAPRPQHLGHAPGLGDAAARGEGGITFEDLAHAAQAVIGQVVGEGREKRARRDRIAVDA